jgi:hypothetical protein
MGRWVAACVVCWETTGDIGDEKGGVFESNSVMVKGVRTRTLEGETMDRLCKGFTSGVALLLMPSTFSCFSPPEDVVFERVADDVDWDAPISAAERGHIVGDVGPALDLDQEATFVSAWDGGVFVSVETVVALPTRVAMLYASFSAPTQLLRPGVRQSFRLADRQLDQPSVVLLACTGRDIDDYDEFDAPADAVDIVVDEAVDGPPGAVDVQVTGQFEDAIARSSFRLLR